MEETTKRNYFGKTPVWAWILVGTAVGVIIGVSAIYYAIIYGKIKDAEQLTANGQYAASLSELDSLSNTTMFRQQISADKAMDVNLLAYQLRQRCETNCKYYNLLLYKKWEYCRQKLGCSDFPTQQQCINYCVVSYTNL